MTVSSIKNQWPLFLSASVQTVPALLPEVSVSKKHWELAGCVQLYREKY